MNCPFCQAEMEDGYIPFNTPFVLKWVSSLNKRKIRISDKTKLTEVSKIKNVFYCEKCGVFIKKKP